jgi:proton glutamate symport protein
MAGGAKSWSSKLASKTSAWIAFGSPAGLALGFALGWLAYRTGNVPCQKFISALEPLGTAWLGALSVTVMPLVVSVLVSSIAGTNTSQKIGRIGAVSFLCFVSILALAGLISVLSASLFVRGLNMGMPRLAQLGAKGAGTYSSSTASASPWQWVHGFSSSRLLATFTAGYILPLLAAAVLFALLLRKFGSRRREPLVKFFVLVGDFAMLVVRLLPCALPAVVFIFIASLSSQKGFSIVAGIGYYLAAMCATLLAFTGLQYLLARMVGGISIRRFARGVLPAQMTAVSTRSSLASLPPLLEGARDILGLPATVVSLVLPLSVAIFKASRPISAPFKLIFLAHLFGVPLTPGSIAAFVLATLVLSTVSPGVPNAGSLHSIPILLTLGIPLQGIVLLNSVAEIPDFLETLLNVTADMNVAAIVTRFRLPARDAGAEAARLLFNDSDLLKAGGSTAA